MEKFLKYMGKETEEREGEEEEGICEFINTFLTKDLDGQLDGSAKLLKKKLRKFTKLGVDETWFEKAEAEGRLDDFKALFEKVYRNVKMLLKSCEQSLEVGSYSKRDLSGHTALKDAAKELKKTWRPLVKFLIKKGGGVLDV
jgi:hypothetical protein